MRGEVVIRTPDQRLRVFVSSPLGELAAERQAVARAVAALRLTPVLFDAGARPHPPRDLYLAYLAQSDIFVGLYWQRYGQVDPGMQVSGLDEELELARGRGCRGCCMSKRQRPTASRAWPSCWAGSGRRRRIGGSARPPSWGGWSATTWRPC
jgi:Domain of unknown function (DUF4062)